jgi:hypothetical protein
MTVEQYSEPGAVAAYDPDAVGGAIPGLEGFDPSRVAVPRWGINHADGTFVDSLTNAEVAELDVVILGMINQRILWPKVMGESDSPLCKSRDAVHGYPLLVPNGKEGLTFPFDESSFSPDDMQADSGGNRVLECASCSLKDWGAGRGNPPWCSEQFTFVVADPLGGSQALFTVQRTGIAPAKRYITDFIRAREPMFLYHTQIKLRQERKGGPRGTPYCIPEFYKGAKTAPDGWDTFANAFRSIREFVTAPPRDGNGADGDGSAEAAATSSTATGQNPHPTVAPSAIAQQAATLKKPPAKAAASSTFVPPAGDDDLPF